MSEFKSMCVVISNTKEVMWNVRNFIHTFYIYTFKEYVNYDETGRNIDIKDPWGYDIEVYRFCASEIEKCINKLTKIIDNKK